MVAVATTRGERLDARGAGNTRRRGFSLLDVLVSISIIAVLISLILPSLSKVNETARRMVCQSNVRQIGIGVLMYADDFRGHLPPSQFIGNGLDRSDAKQNMDTLRVGDAEPGVPSWDGLGVLFQHDYINAPKVFYCPSHHGDNPYSAYALAWGESIQEIISNYHYRGEGPRGHARDASGRVRTTTRLYDIDPAQSSLVADGLRSQSDYNHRVGVNFFRADLTVHWYDDASRQLLTSLPESEYAVQTPGVIDGAWTMLDQSANGAQPQ